MLWSQLWWVAMAVDTCSACGGKGSLRGPCPACGSSRLGDAFETGVAGLLLGGLAAAAAVCGYMLWKHPIDIAALTRMDAQAALAPKALGAPKVTDFEWVQKAMDGCDKDAVADKDGLYFLIIPLARGEKDDPQWKPQPIGKAGNAELIPTKEALEGLKSGLLKVYPGEYLFSATEGTTNVGYRWNAVNGVAKLSHAGKSIESFRLVFRTLKDRTGAGETSEFSRFEGTCHWVAALITK
jgi:hypothetical protein